MTTWVLVLILQTGTGVGMATVPGYVERSKCNEAGLLWLTGNLPAHSTARFNCIPGVGR